MKVAIVHSFYSSRQPSGENQVVLAQADALARAGHEVRLIARHTDEEARTTGYRLRASLAAANVVGPSPSAQLEAFDPDVVHVHNLFPNWGTGWLSRWGHRTVATLHNARPLCANGLLWREGAGCRECLDAGTTRAIVHRCYRDSRVATLPLAWASRGAGAHQPILRRTRALIALNEPARALFAATTDTPVRVLPNFVTVEPGLDRDAAPHRGGWLYVGRLSPEKGPLEMIEAFPVDQDLTIVGDGPLAEEVARVASTHGRVRYEGRLQHGAVMAHVAAARGLIVPSLYSEGLPTVALEALAVGTPVVVSRHCAAAQELTRGGAGVVYDPAAAGALRAALGRVAADPGAGRSATQLFEARYTEAAWLKSIEELYRGVMASCRDEGAT